MSMIPRTTLPYSVGCCGVFVVFVDFLVTCGAKNILVDTHFAHILCLATLLISEDLRLVTAFNYFVVGARLKGIITPKCCFPIQPCGVSSILGMVSCLPLTAPRCGLVRLPTSFFHKYPKGSDWGTISVPPFTHQATSSFYNQKSRSFSEKQWRMASAPPVMFRKRVVNYCGDSMSHNNLGCLPNLSSFIQGFTLLPFSVDQSFLPPPITWWQGMWLRILSWQCLHLLPASPLIRIMVTMLATITASEMRH